MILLLAVLAGLLVGLLISLALGRPYRIEELNHAWLVPMAVIPQLLLFEISFTAGLFSDQLAAGVLMVSQTILLIFVFLNWHLFGMQLLGIGLILNLLVIVSNGGLMPIAPETVGALFPEVSSANWEIGARIGRSKNILLPPEETVLAGFSDAILLPAWFPWMRALSLGDLLIALGVFWHLAQGKVEEKDPIPVIGGNRKPGHSSFQGRYHDQKFYKQFHSDKSRADSDWF